MRAYKYFKNWLRGQSIPRVKMILRFFTFYLQFPSIAFGVNSRKKNESDRRKFTESKIANDYTEKSYTGTVILRLKPNIYRERDIVEHVSTFNLDVFMRVCPCIFSVCMNACSRKFEIKI